MVEVIPDARLAGAFRVASLPPIVTFTAMLLQFCAAHDGTALSTPALQDKAIDPPYPESTLEQVAVAVPPLTISAEGKTAPVVRPTVTATPLVVGHGALAETSAFACSAA
jgi:hypothetical protein